MDAYSEKIDVDGNNIYLDEDGLISAGTGSTQITWMDAKVDGKAITPRNGKTVELNTSVTADVANAYDFKISK